jgi:hypothetical protein
MWQSFLRSNFLGHLGKGIINTLGTFARKNNLFDRAGQIIRNIPIVN